MKKNNIIAALSFLGLFSATNAYAICPVCAVAVASGLGVSRWLGIDDSVSGLWIGGIIVSMIYWTIDFFDKKKINFWQRDLITIIFYYLIVILPMYLSDLFIGSWNIFSSYADKLLMGILVGSFAFWAGNSVSNHLKEKNNGKAYFPFQKVAFPVGFLVIMSFIMTFVAK